jgi:hypothetical protein
MDQDDFYDEVQSFSFWFGAVEGYLTDRPYGYDPATVDEPLGETRRQNVITALCNYCVGEAAALEASSGMVRLAPNHNARIFMATQVVDEARHLEVVDAGDWEAAVLAQNVILETMEFTVFRHHAQTADPVTRQVLTGVISDERRHLGFGENDLGPRLLGDVDTRERLAGTRAELDALVLASFDATFDALGRPRDRRPDLGRDYLDAVDRLGLVG